MDLLIKTALRHLTDYDTSFIFPIKELRNIVSGYCCDELDFEEELLRYSLEKSKTLKHRLIYRAWIRELSTALQRLRSFYKILNSFFEKHRHLTCFEMFCIYSSDFCQRSLCAAECSCLRPVIFPHFRQWFNDETL